MRTLSLASTTLALALALAGGLGACASSEPAPASGQLSIPLTTSVGNEVYRLSPATFEITGPGGTTVLDGSPSVASVTTELPPGLTTVLLRPGWSLARSSDGGQSYQPVSALLGSTNPVPLRVLADTATTVSFDFLIRNPSGTLTVRFGVNTAPRQLAGGMSVTSGTGELAAYTGKRLDFSTYFGLYSLSRRLEDDGGKTLLFSAGANATEFFNDALGLLSSVVGPAMAGGFLEYRITAKLDGTQEFYGEYYGGSEPYPTFILGPIAIASVPADAEGYPTDAFFIASVPYTLQVFRDGIESTAAGRFTLRHLVP